MIVQLDAADWWRIMNIKKFIGGVIHHAHPSGNRYRCFRNDAFRLKRRIDDICRTRDLKIFLITMLIYIVNRFWLKHMITQPIISYILKCHFNDFCGGIVFLAYVNMLITGSRYNGAQIRTLPLCLMTGVFISLCWEGLGPLLLSYSTGDWLDALAYLAGCFVYWLICEWRNP